MPLGEVLEELGRPDEALEAYRLLMEHAEDGQEGIDMTYSEMPELILLDMSLPVIDGWGVAKHLKGDDATKHIPIIALTAHAMSGDREKSLEAGCDEYETKPIRLPDLLAKMDSLLNS